jgi:DNA-binding CsgD family transcriptional regulator
MRFELYGNRLFYFFIVYSFLFLLGKVDDILEITNQISFIVQYDRHINTFEMIQGILYLLLTFFLYQEFRATRKEIDMAIFSLSELKEKNVALQNHEQGFWNRAHQEMIKWGFTETEQQISLLLLRGFSNRQIAAVRGKSLRTIENQTFSIYQKSGMRGKVEFISFFISPLLPEED